MALLSAVLTTEPDRARAEAIARRCPFCFATRFCRSISFSIFSSLFFPGASFFLSSSKVVEVFTLSSLLDNKPWSQESLPFSAHEYHTYNRSMF